MTGFITSPEIKSYTLLGVFVVLQEPTDKFLEYHESGSKFYEFTFDCFQGTLRSSACRFDKVKHSNIRYDRENLKCNINVKTTLMVVGKAAVIVFAT